LRTTGTRLRACPIIARLCTGSDVGGKLPACDAPLTRQHPDLHRAPDQYVGAASDGSIAGVGSLEQPAPEVDRDRGPVSISGVDLIQKKSGPLDHGFN